MKKSRQTKIRGPATRRKLKAGSAASPGSCDSKRAIDLVMQLMAIPGASGREEAVAQFITNQLEAAGAPKSAICFDNAHQRTPFDAQIGNLLLRLPGTTRQGRRMLTAHLDTVPICVGSRPVRKGKWVRSADAHTGLGADNRAGCAVLLNTAIEIFRRKLPHPPLIFCWFIQEEIGLQGSRAATRSLWGKPRLAFNWDGGSPTKLTIGATGGYRTSIEVEGIASHAGGAPEHGVSAITIASLAIADLHQRGWHGDIHQNGKHGTSNVGVIQGGAATNVVTDRLSIRAEARSHDPKFRKLILREIERAFKDAVQQVRNVGGKRGKVRFDTNLDYESFLLKQDEPCVLLAESTIRALGQEPVRAVANGGVDANWMTAHGVPTVTLGCGQRFQHTVSETLNLDEFTMACEIGLRLATGD